ncbi:MAG: hypothetical protein V4621_01730 [Pseudomonadota bacterium]
MSSSGAFLDVCRTAQITPTDNTVKRALIKSIRSKPGDDLVARARRYAAAALVTQSYSALAAAIKDMPPADPDIQAARWLAPLARAQSPWSPADFSVMDLNETVLKLMTAPSAFVAAETQAQASFQALFTTKHLAPADKLNLLQTQWDMIATHLPGIQAILGLDTPATSSTYALAAQHFYDTGAIDLMMLAALPEPTDEHIQAVEIVRATQQARAQGTLAVPTPLYVRDDVYERQAHSEAALRLIAGPNPDENLIAEARSSFQFYLAQLDYAWSKPDNVSRADESTTGLRAAWFMFHFGQSLAKMAKDPYAITPLLSPEVLQNWLHAKTFAIVNGISDLKAQDAVFQAATLLLPPQKAEGFKQQIKDELRLSYDHEPEVSHYDYYQVMLRDCLGIGEASQAIASRLTATSRDTDGIQANVNAITKFTAEMLESSLFLDAGALHVLQQALHHAHYLKYLQQNTLTSQDLPYIAWQNLEGVLAPPSDFDPGDISLLEHFTAGADIAPNSVDIVAAPVPEDAPQWLTDFTRDHAMFLTMDTPNRLATDMLVMLKFVAVVVPKSDVRDLYLDRAKDMDHQMATLNLMRLCVETEGLTHLDMAWDRLNIAPSSRAKLADICIKPNEIPADFVGRVSQTANGRLSATLYVDAALLKSPDDETLLGLQKALKAPSAYRDPHISDSVQLIDMAPQPHSWKGLSFNDAANDGSADLGICPETLAAKMGTLDDNTQIAPPAGLNRNDFTYKG